MANALSGACMLPMGMFHVFRTRCSFSVVQGTPAHCLDEKCVAQAYKSGKRIHALYACAQFTSLAVLLASNLKLSVGESTWET
jgi:hypothetical protein